eukprot:TRINITY_DN16673_c0_g1_i1.p2 TRINITY_DN16673_c0_g1~~TRINITY_DN16673_c0_g1_i1.p2  ORF type:complete len:75 (-),score=8.28 TRINITY_DN16673_c0_g1_i1:57-281(-)
MVCFWGSSYLTDISATLFCDSWCFDLDSFFFLCSDLCALSFVAFDVSLDFVICVPYVHQHQHLGTHLEGDTPER